MNLKQSLRRKLRGHAGETELNLTAVMNIFLILIPFLLLTAVFVRIAVLELALPNLNRQAPLTQEKKSKSTILNILLIQRTGFELKSPDLRFTPIPTKNRRYDWESLKQQLEKVKTKYPESEDIIISPENEIKYDTIISVMDRCREAGFPNIPISG